MYSPVCSLWLSNNPHSIADSVCTPIGVLSDVSMSDVAGDKSMQNPKLTPNEKYVLRGATYGLTPTEIAVGLDLSPQSVGREIADIYCKVHQLVEIQYNSWDSPDLPFTITLPRIK
jgi:hypothetical protein